MPHDKIRPLPPIGALLTGLLLALTGCGDSDSSALGARANAGSGAWPDDGSQSRNATSTLGQPAPPQSTNLSFGGAQDMGVFREQLSRGQVPSPTSLDAAGFFAEHHVSLPPAACGKRVCLQPMAAVMGNLMTGENCTMLNLGLNSPIAADPGARPPLSLTVVVDVSGSMQGDKIRFVREGLELLIDGMRDGDQLAIVTYSDEPSVVAPLAPVADKRVELRRIVQTLSAHGGTNLADGLSAGYDQLQSDYDSARQNRVILLSDGQPTVGIQNTEAILSLSAASNSDGIGLTTVGLGGDFNLPLMRGLAEQADGNFYFLEDTGAVDEVFREELSYFVVPVAFDLELNLSAGPAYDFGRAMGAPGWEDTPEGGTLAVPSVFVAHRESADDVTESNGRRGGGSSLLVELMPRSSGQHEADAIIATVDVSFREPGQAERQHDSVALRYPHTPDTLLREGWFQSDDMAAVQKSFVMLNIFVGMERAVMAFHSRSAGPQTIG